LTVPLLDGVLVSGLIIDVSGCLALTANMLNE
jgi:hypothetical protein